MKGREVRPGSRSAAPAAARLLITLGGRPVDRGPASAWRAVVMAGDGSWVSPEAHLAQVRPGAMAARSDRQVIAAAADPDPDSLVALADSGDGGVVALTRYLMGLRLAGSDPAAATEWLRPLIEPDGPAPWEHRVLHRYLPGLLVRVGVAPGVGALLAPGQDSSALLVVDCLMSLGRQLDAASLLARQEPSPPVVVARAAVLLATGQNEAVVGLTEGIENLSDLSALALVARGVAQRTLGRFDEARVAFDAAVAMPNRHPGVRAGALEERANLAQLVGDEVSAQADLDALRQLADPTGTLDGDPVLDPEPATVRPAPAPSAEPGRVDEEDRARAASRVRRRITGVGQPGTFGGRHHSTYETDVEAMLTAGQFEAAENLLLGLLDAVEDEAEDLDHGVVATFYLTLSDVYTHRGQPAEATAVMDRLRGAAARHGVTGEVPEELAATLHEPVETDEGTGADETPGPTATPAEAASQVS